MDTSQSTEREFPMKVDKTAAKELTSALREFGTRQDSEDGMELFLIEDASVVFSKDQGQPVFQGLSFEMVGRDFHVLPNLDLALSETVSDGTDSRSEVFSIEDQEFVAQTSSYLLWRAGFLRKLNV